MQSKIDRLASRESIGLEELSYCCHQLLRASRENPVPRSLYRVLKNLLDQVCDNLRFDHLALGFVKNGTNTIEFVLQTGEACLPSEVMVLPDSLGIVVRNFQPMEVTDVAAEKRFPAFCERAKSNGFRSFRVVPLKNDDYAMGVICVQRRDPGSFSTEDARYLDHAAQLIAVVLENAAMAHILAREKSRLETLRDVNTALISSLDLNEIFQQVSSLIGRIINQDYTHFTLYDKHADAMKFYGLEAANEAHVVVPENLVPVPECPAGIAFKQGQVLQFTHDDLVLINSQYTNELLNAGIRTVSCFPLVSHRHKLGALGLACRRDHLPTSDDVELLTQIASEIAMAIDNARAYEEIAGLKDRLTKEKSYLEEEIRSHHNFGEMIGNSPALHHVLTQVEIAAPSDATVMVLGETGTGKELVARALHRLSSRRDEPFIKLNCAAIPTGLLESELFGHEKGAFTGAVSQKVGRLELADKGTLFLDEIGEIPTELQPKLLRVLQDHEFERLGGIRTIKVNVRLVAATNRNLSRAVENGQFRRDLYYRLNVFPIHLPALRERQGDIPLLVRYFVQTFSRRMGKNIDSIPVEIIRELERWSWPGNIRELEHFIERSVILTRGTSLFAPIGELRVLAGNGSASANTLEDVEREYILRILRESHGVIAGVHGAAARLGMKRTTLQSRINRLGIRREDYEAHPS